MLPTWSVSDTIATASRISVDFGEAGLTPPFDIGVLDLPVLSSLDIPAPVVPDFMALAGAILSLLVSFGAPAFVASETTLFMDGPMWRIAPADIANSISPTEPNAFASLSLAELNSAVSSDR